MADPVDDDVLAAVRALWQTDGQTLPALVDRPPGAGALRSTRDQPLPLPYAHLACESVQGKHQRYPKGIRKDCRKVTVTVYGTYDQARDALAAVLDLFSSRLGYNGRTLAFPSGAKFVKWWPLDNGTIVKDEAVREGLQVWRGACEGEVYSVRTEV